MRFIWRCILCSPDVDRLPIRVWHICEQATRTRFSSLSWFQRKTMGWLLFSPLWKQMTKSIATKSAQAAVGGWVLDYVPPDPGSSDYGVTYHRCAIRDLAHAVGAEAFAPFICQSDAVMSELLGWGSAPHRTIAQGQSKCDFRFRKGQPTDVHASPGFRWYGSHPRPYEASLRFIWAMRFGG